MKIVKLICSEGKTGFFFDDQKAIKANAVQDGNSYKGKPATGGFSKVRQAGESISIMLVLEDGQVAYGDCAAVQYSGAGGRDPLFLATQFIPIIEKDIAPLFVGKEIKSFKEMALKADSYVDSSGKKLHTAIRYGITQALLDAVAKSKGKLMAQVIADEYGTTISSDIIPIFSQSGDDRYLNVDKMILKNIPVLPHALINNVEKLGEKGEKLQEYIKWLVKRSQELKTTDSYAPILHIDVYGTIGIIFNNDLKAITDYIISLEKYAHPLKLRIEGPIDTGERESQIEALKTIRKYIDDAGCHVEIVADEWCNTYEDIVDFTNVKAGHMAQIKTPDLGGINNTIEAVIYCKKHEMGAYLGGTCNETDRSAQVCAHIAMAVQPDQYLAKPGMGVDEGFMIVNNEMQRILALKDVL